MNILAVGAHPDDLEYGCGGYLALRGAAGDRVTCFIGTAGERGGDTFTRYKEQVLAASLLRVNQTLWGGWPDTQIVLGDAIERLEGIIHDERIDVVLTHTPDDSHQDHRTMGQATLAASRRVSRVLCYHAPSSTRVMERVVCQDIGSVIRLKLDALRAYASQFRHRLEDLAEAEARFWGGRAGVTYAEAFEPVRWLL